VATIKDQVDWHEKQVEKRQRLYPTGVKTTVSKASKASKQGEQSTKAKASTPKK
jgi:hypothetical protein